jgi:hypothetical protein
VIRQQVPCFALCVCNKDYPASLEVRKVYRLLSDPAAAKLHRVRVIDESCEGYLYPEEYFVPIKTGVGREGCLGGT